MGLPIRVIGVSRAFRGGGGVVQAIDDVTLEVPAGEICVLVGPSGCGKTTAMRMVNRTVEITSGEIEIGGTPMLLVKRDWSSKRSACLRNSRKWIRPT